MEVCTLTVGIGRCHGAGERLAARGKGGGVGAGLSRALLQLCMQGSRGGAGAGRKLAAAGELSPWEAGLGELCGHVSCSGAEKAHGTAIGWVSARFGPPSRPRFPEAGPAAACPTSGLFQPLNCRLALFAASKAPHASSSPRAGASTRLHASRQRRRKDFMVAAVSGMRGLRTAGRLRIRFAAGSEPYAALHSGKDPKREGGQVLQLPPLWRLSWPFITHLDSTDEVSLCRRLVR